jgi:phosphohistidine phosphatase
MELLVIRHGPAGKKAAWAETGEPDEARPLTARGRKRTKAAARGLAAEMGGVDVIATSPLVRAAETAEIVAKALGGAEPVALDALRPERRPDELLEWLRSLDAGATAAVVGHDPHLSFLVGWLLTGRDDAFVELKKPGTVLLRFDDPPSGGNALLLWALAPRHLRALGSGRKKK